MITDLETLLNEDQFRELVKAINENKPYKYNKDGLTIESNSGDNYLNLVIAYDEDKKEKNLANRETTEFQTFLESLDDDLFTDVCEYLNDIQEIQDCLNSSKLETVRAGINKFKNALSEVAKNKIKELMPYVRTDCTNTHSSCQCKC